MKRTAHGFSPTAVPPRASPRRCVVVIACDVGHLGAGGRRAVPSGEHRVAGVTTGPSTFRPAWTRSGDSAGSAIGRGNSMPRSPAATMMPPVAASDNLIDVGRRCWRDLRAQRMFGAEAAKRSSNGTRSAAERRGDGDQVDFPFCPRSRPRRGIAIGRGREYVRRRRQWMFTLI